MEEFGDLEVSAQFVTSQKCYLLFLLVPRELVFVTMNNGKWTSLTQLKKVSSRKNEKYLTQILFSEFQTYLLKRPMTNTEKYLPQVLFSEFQTNLLKRHRTNSEKYLEQIFFYEFSKDLRQIFFIFLRGHFFNFIKLVHFPLFCF